MFGVKPENLIGLPTVRYLARNSSSTSTTVPLAHRAGSLAISFIDSTGAHGTPDLRRISTASNLVLRVFFKIPDVIQPFLIPQLDAAQLEHRVLHRHGHFLAFPGLLAAEQRAHHAPCQLHSGVAVA